MEKILYIITQSEIGGAQKYVLDLATNLNKSQYEIYVASTGDGPLFEAAKAQKIATKRLKWLKRSISPFKDIMAYFELKSLISEIKPDIVHLNSSKAGFLGSCAAKKLKVKKIIYTAHGFVFNEPGNFLKKIIYKKLEKSNSKRADKIICVSKRDRMLGIKAKMNEKKLITIYNGIDPQKIGFLEKDEAIKELEKEIAQRAGESEADKFSNATSPKIVCVANFYKTKGVDCLVKAMKNIDAVLVLVGDGQENENLKNLAKENNLQEKIIFAGRIPFAARFLKAFDLFVLPSRKEGLPYALLEACAANIPTVTTDVGGTHEVIMHGINGYLVKPNDKNDLREKINQALLENKPSYLPEYFTLEEMIKKTITLYRS